MTEIEKVEKLREKANVSFAEAKDALDFVGGDVLDALIYLEKQGKATVPPGGGFFSGADASNYERRSSSDGGAYRATGSGGAGAGGSDGFYDMLRRFGRFCSMLLQKGNSNFLDAIKDGELLFSLPVTVLVVLILFFFWIIIPLFIISLFVGFRYKFRGPDLGRDNVNSVMDGAASVVEDVKKSFSEDKTRM